MLLKQLKHTILSLLPPEMIWGPAICYPWPEVWGIPIRCQKTDILWATFFKVNDNKNFYTYFPLPRPVRNDEIAIPLGWGRNETFLTDTNELGLASFSFAGWSCPCGDRGLVVCRGRMCGQVFCAPTTALAEDVFLCERDKREARKDEKFLNPVNEIKSYHPYALYKRMQELRGKFLIEESTDIIIQGEVV